VAEELGDDHEVGAAAHELWSRTCS
jgi:hypothetical protein